MPFAIISYDIGDDRRRNKIAKLLLNYGQRVQYSVFELFENREELEALFASLQELIIVEEDSLRMYILCKSCRAEISLAGKEKLYEPDDKFIIV